VSDISISPALGLGFTWTHRIILPNKLSIYYQLRQDVAMSAGAAIEVRGLSKKYGAKTAVDGIDLTVERGEIFALLGPNGAGKTTTVEILEGYRKASSGDVRVLGFDPATKGSAAQRWRNQIGIVLQSTSDAADLSVFETSSHYANY